MIACFQLAQSAGIPYFVAEHNEDRSHWRVYKIENTENTPNTIVLDGSLFDYVMFLCKLHDYTPPQVIKNA